MKFKVFLFVIGVAIWFTAVAFYSMQELPEDYKPKSVFKSEQKELDEPVPEFSFTTYYDQTFNITDIQKPVIMIHFWADWCLTCKVEFPKLYELLYRYQGKVALVTINIDESKKTMWKLMSFLDENNFDLRHQNMYWGMDKDKFLSNKTFSILKLPETFFINADRQMVFKTTGGTDWLGDDITGRINEMLK